jgi:hypothetical protein
MEFKRIHYGFAAASFFIALLTYGLTMQPTIPFWDCGEFAAAAIGMGVPHPPGAPLWTIVGRLGMLIPIFTDMTARYNFLSVLSSAASILLLYLTIVRLITLWRGAPKSMADVLVHFGGAFIGALAYTFTDSFWFNALECEVYAFGSLFISLVPWLILVWYDHADEPHSEKYLLLIAYVIGLSLGVHQLALLTLFPVFMLVYYKRWPKTTVKGWILMVISSVVAFWFIFKIVLSDLVDWAGGAGWMASFLILAGIIGGIIYTHQKKKAIWNVALWGAILIFTGYTTYTVIMVRAAQNPPMNQHHASTFKILAEYINREQYGEAKEMPRRLEEQNRDHSHDATFNNYSSDGDFFWRYQTGHMFTRYLMWNFVGRANDEQDAGVDYSKTWALPFLLGLFGLFWHFKRDPKRALTLVGTFIIMGFLTAWYQNQQDPQPRERDYFYVGAFYIYAMWLGIGATGILEFIRSRFSKKEEGTIVVGEESDVVPILTGRGNAGVIFGGVALLLLIIPINMCIGLAGLATGQPFSKASKWAEYSRRHNYVPYEYAYNFLQSCDKNAILFTAGDNDTFPLWCLQDVYGIRRDIRIVNLSLGNMSWYIKQLKHERPWDAADVIDLPSFTDEKMSNPDESEAGIRALGGPAENVSFDVSAQTMQQFNGVAAPGRMDWKYTGQFPQEGGQYVFTIADQLVKDIVRYNIEKRPIYFASLVPPSYMAGLDPYLVYEGMAARVTPTHQPGNSRSMDVSVNEPLYSAMAYNLPKSPSLTPARGMVLETYRDPEANLSAQDQRYAQSYFYMYFRLANHFIKVGKPAEARRALDTCEARLSPSTLGPDYRYADLFAQLYDAAGDSIKSVKYMKMAVADTKQPSADAGDQSNGSAASIQFRLAEVYLKSGMLDSARALYLKLQGEVQGGDRQVMDFKILEVDARILDKKGDKKGAYDKYVQLAKAFAPLASSGLAPEYATLDARRAALAKELGIVDAGLVVVPPQSQQMEIGQPQEAPPAGTPGGPPQAPKKSKSK